jgi:transcription initiation factor IIE alpha subunit
MMPQEIEYLTCLGCGTTHRVAEMKPGARFPCSKCGNPLTVPAAPQGSEESTMSRNVAELRKQIEQEEKKKKPWVVIKPQKRSRKSP